MRVHYYQKIIDAGYLPVVAAVIVAKDGRLLLSKRAKHAHQGGLWEFPGGKVEPNEQPLQALARELHEELAISIDALQCRPLIQIPYHYGEKSVFLDVWWVQGYSGTPCGREGQEIAFVDETQIPCLPFPEANRSILQAIRLGDSYLITPEPPLQSERWSAYLQQLQNSVAVTGSKVLYLRAHNLDIPTYTQLATEVSQLLANTATTLMLSAPVMPQHGWHLRSDLLATLTQRPANISWLSASCHSLQQLQQAQHLGVDFVTLSPLRVTATHPQAVPLGWEKWQQWVSQVTMPVFALGGMEPNDIDRAVAAGGQGIAAIRSLWHGKTTGTNRNG